jgi:beta-fructofuranosidase
VLRLDDRWVWDFWFADDGDDRHVFYLQAPRSLGDPELRHRHATIGHAVSRDLRSWTVLPDALHAGPAGAFDDRATWTGSVIAHGDRWWMFYTGISHADGGRVQRIGAATSPDLRTWTRHPGNPLVTADDRWYERLDPTVWHEESWRDPWMYADPRTGRFRMLITARAADGPADRRGVIGQALSDDLEHWEVTAPLVGPGAYGHLEVPQLVTLAGRWYLLYSVYGWAHTAEARARGGVVSGTHHLVADSPDGPFVAPAGGHLLLADPVGTHYAGKIVTDPGGAPVFLAFAQYPPTPDGAATAVPAPFIGALSDPMPVHVDRDGALRVTTPAR